MDREYEEALTVVGQSIEEARRQLEDAAPIIANSSNQKGWAQHAPWAEMVLYLCKVDYDIKVLLHHLLTDPANRMVWERYLALELYEALETVPKAMNRTRRSLQDEPARLARFAAAQATFKETIRPIRSNNDFMSLLRQIRNEVAAHHGLNKGKGLESMVLWSQTAAYLSDMKIPPRESAWAIHALTLVRAIQDFAKAIEKRP